MLGNLKEYKNVILKLNFSLFFKVLTSYLCAS